MIQAGGCDHWAATLFQRGVSGVCLWRFLCSHPADTWMG